MLRRRNAVKTSSFFGVVVTTMVRTVSDGSGMNRGR